ncbi:MAG TPA: CbtB domain-containing protein [Paracoccaceae bacterium]|nr:CbtB domain-containing protein [Paracoccaceae bacterium]
MTSISLGSARQEAGYASILVIALLGAALIFLAGFAQPEALHAAAHDSRHVAGFPCH